MATSCTIGRPSGVVAAAICTAVMRFSSLSVRTSPMGSCDPVMMTGLARFSQHKRQGGGRVGHGVGAVEHHEAVVGAVVVGYSLGDGSPMVGIHVARIYGMVK